MRCECCDRLLTDGEASAKFVEKDGSKPSRFVNMCRTCRSFLPPTIQYVVTQPDTNPEEEPDDDYEDPFDLGAGEGGDWDEV